MPSTSNNQTSSSSSVGDVDEYIYRAKLAEQAERYQEMIQYMRYVCETKTTSLSEEERNLLSIAYKNGVGARREAWSKIFTLESMERTRMESCKDKGLKSDAAKYESQAKYCKEYRSKIERELTAICRDILSILNEHLIPTENAEVASIVPDIIASTAAAAVAGHDLDGLLRRNLDEAESKNGVISSISNGEAMVFYFKMMGDYYRYLAEFNVETEEARLDASSRAAAAYLVATEIAQAHLKPSHPVRLGLALNFSVFYYEIMSQPDRACTLAKNCFDDAIAELDADDASGTEKDSTLIMQLLRDNLELWTSDMNEREEPPLADA